MGYTIKCDKSKTLGSLKVNPVEWTFTPATSSIAIAIDNPIYYQNQKDVTTYLEKINLEELPVVTQDIATNMIVPSTPETIKTIDSTEEAQIKEEWDINNDGVPEPINMWAINTVQPISVNISIPGMGNLQFWNEWMKLNGNKFINWDDDDDEKKKKKWWYGWWD
jgi:hypothetical protein